jgi:hypothetical protein
VFPVVQHLTKLTKLEYECDGKLSSLGTHLTPLINLTELALNSCSFDGQLLDSMLCNFSKLKVLRLREYVLAPVIKRSGGLNAVCRLGGIVQNHFPFNS